MSPSAPQEDKMSENASHSSDNKDDKTTKLERDIKTGEICLIMINGLLLITTIVIAVIYNGQLKQMIKATEATQDSAIAAKSAAETAYQTLLTTKRERAGFLIIEENQITPGWFMAEAKFKLRNSGQTVVRQIREEVGSEYFSADKIDWDDIKKRMDNTVKQATININGFSIENGGGFETSISPDPSRIEDVYARKTHFIFWVVFSYVDIFDETHHYGKCFYSSGNHLGVWYVACPVQP
jgi:hypothetical protein